MICELIVTGQSSDSDTQKETIPEDDVFCAARPIPIPPTPHQPPIKR